MGFRRMTTREVEYTKIEPYSQKNCHVYVVREGIRKVKVDVGKLVMDAPGRGGVIVGDNTKRGIAVNTENPVAWNVYIGSVALAFLSF